MGHAQSHLRRRTRTPSDDAENSVDGRALGGYTAVPSQHGALGEQDEERYTWHERTNHTDLGVPHDDDDSYVAAHGPLRQRGAKGKEKDDYDDDSLPVLPPEMMLAVLSRVHGTWEDMATARVSDRTLYGDVARAQGYVTGPMQTAPTCVRAIARGDCASACELVAAMPGVVACTAWDDIDRAMSRRGGWPTAVRVRVVDDQVREAHKFERDGDEGHCEYDPNRDGTLCAIEDITGYKAVSVALVTDQGVHLPLDGVSAVLTLRMPARICSVYSVSHGGRLASPGDMNRGEKHYADAAHVVGMNFIGSGCGLRRAIMAFQLGRLALPSMHDPAFCYELGRLKREPRARRGTGKGCGGHGIYFFPDFQSARGYSKQASSPLITKRLESRRGLVLDLGAHDGTYTREQAKKKTRELERWLRECAAVRAAREERTALTQPMAQRFMLFIDALPFERST